MRKEKFAGQKRFPRRQFMEAWFWAGLGLFAGTLAPPPPIFEPLGEYPLPGWPERAAGRGRAPFLSPYREGARDWLAEVCAGHEVMRTLVAGRLHSLLYESHPGAHPRLGDDFSAHLDKTTSALTQFFGGIPAIDNVFHAGLLTYTYASVPQYYERPGVLGPDGMFPVDLPEKEGKRHRLFANALYGLPIIRPADKDYCYGQNDYAARCVGTDRLAHFLVNMLMAHEDIYARTHNLPERWRKPLALQIYTKFMRPNNYIADVTEQAALVNTTHELRESMFHGKGYDDGLVRLDQAANQDGKNIGVLLTDGSLTRQKLLQGIALMNANILTHVRHNTNPPPLLDVPVTAPER